MAALLDIEDLVVRRGGWSARIPALHLAAGGAAALFAPSGAGKSSLLAGLFGLLDDAGVTGVVRWRGAAWSALPGPARRRALREEIVFLPQDAAAALDPLAPIGRQVAQATGVPVATAAATLGELGVGHPEALCRRLPHEVSGGEAQRALLAIAFLRQPALLVADEPTAGLDAEAHRDVLQRLQALRGRGVALLLATHDPRLPPAVGAVVHLGSDDGFRPGSIAVRPWPAAGAIAEVGQVPVLAARGIAIAFGGRVVLEGVDFVVHRGEVVALLGASGAGKTTLARILAGHLQPDAGTLERPARRPAVQLVPQDAFASLTPGRSVASLLAETALGTDAAAAAARLQLAADPLARSAGQLSGGERRRAALLRALSVRPDVLLLDEPTAGLDREAAIAVVQAVLALQRERGLAVVLITHDHELAAAVARRTVELRGGRLCEG
ncbi:MAG: ATP-binding cassette domain-containing protein [Planctomycetes bacterium]|nr:ATP-binding cassette domain-containing protein [Planctomycetota bacterium]